MKIRATRRDLRCITAAAALLGVALMSLPALAQGTPDQRAACQDDALRLCQQFVSDAAGGRTGGMSSCMRRHRSELSARCAVYFGGSRRIRRRDY
jgi:carbohydrate-selective porin OprB